MYAGQKSCAIFIIIIGIFIPIILFVMMVGMAKKYFDQVCKWQVALNILLGADRQKMIAMYCTFGQGGNTGGGGAGTAGSFLSTNCDATAQAIAIKTEYLNWTNDASNLYLRDETAKYFPGGQPVAILTALIKIESGWNPKAYNSSTATGLGQFITSTAKSRTEFVGGSKKGTLKTFPAGKIYDAKPPPDDDARFDAQRSIYAAAHYFKETINSTNGACGSKKGLGRFTCAYAYAYNGGCAPNLKDVLPASGHGKTYCQIAMDAAGKMAKYYEEYAGGGSGANCSSVKLAEQTAKDVETLDGGAKNKNMADKKSTYAQGRTWTTYTDCTQFVYYVIHNTSDPSFKYVPPGDNVQQQFNYVKSSGKYDMIPIHRATDAMPGDILVMGSCTAINNCVVKKHTNIYIGNGMVASASLNDFGPRIQKWWSDMAVAYRLK